MIILTAILIFWLLLRITDRLIGRFSAQADGSCRVETRSLFMLGRRVFKILLFIIIVLLVLRSFGVDVTTALAGLGIGGIILGFGAQKTVENLFGGVSVLTDRVLHVGDFCKVGDQLGTIEDIGLRSTRIRRADRTLVAIPNGTIANATVENYSMREKILFKPTIGVRYETSADQLRYLLVQIRELLISHPKVESSTARARLIGFGPSSIDLEVFAYILSTTYPEFLAIQEDLLFRIMGLIEDSGTSFAFPSQTMYVRKDERAEPEKTKAAEDIVRRWREESQLPFPEHDPAAIARLENTLSYPPPASALKKEK
jgi:MscS family membrane protein